LFKVVADEEFVADSIVLKAACVEAGNSIEAAITDRGERMISARAMSTMLNLLTRDMIVNLLNSKIQKAPVIKA